MATLLGIDPGYGRCGWAVIDDTCTYRDCGVIVTPLEDDSQRLFQLYSSLLTIINTFQPSSCGIEKLFFNKNVKTAIPVAQAIGVIKLVLAQQNIPCSEYTPVQVKLAITGYGRSSKDQLSTIVKKILKIHSLAQYDDAFDALAIALCHYLALPHYTAINKTQKLKKSYK